MPRKKIKTKMFSMKVSPEELDSWRVMARDHRISLTELIRIRLADTQPAAQPVVKRRPPPSVDERIVFQVAAIGNNLNQIARRCNSGERLAVLGELTEIERDLLWLIELARSGKLSCT